MSTLTDPALAQLLTQLDTVSQETIRQVVMFGLTAHLFWFHIGLIVLLSACVLTAKTCQRWLKGKSSWDSDPIPLREYLIFVYVLMAIGGLYMVIKHAVWIKAWWFPYAYFLDYFLERVQ